MDKETFKKLAQNPDLISGIYNYCDRWCERCAFTARCLTYLTEQHDENLQSYDMESKEFWTNLEDSFKLTFELLEEMAQEQGIDLNLLEADRHQEKRRAEIRKQAEEHECAQAACKYMNMASEWLKTAQDLFKQKSEELDRQFLADIPETNPESQAADLMDIIEVIQWYKRFIWVKIMRALQGEMEDRVEELEDFPKDSDGSAKIALIAIDRTITSWAKMREHFIEREDEILEILVLLERLRKAMEQTFPNARAFVRPGFDEEVTANNVD